VPRKPVTRLDGSIAEQDCCRGFMPLFGTRMPEIVRVVVELEDNEAWELAQFVKRAGAGTTSGKCTVDDNEAYIIRDAVVKLERALQSADYQPR
jgi:hypothetical protein